MKYLVEPIGAQFSNKDLGGLAERFTSHAAQGFKLHTVFQVSQPGCLGLTPPTVTYLAVYAKE
jgi:hypothetical protein